MGFVKVANIFPLLEKITCFQTIYNIKLILTEQVWESCSTFVFESLFHVKYYILLTVNWESRFEKRSFKLGWELVTRVFFRHLKSRLI